MVVLRGRVPLLGNKNALKNGSYTREAIAKRRRIQDLVRQSLLLLKQFE